MFTIYPPRFSKICAGNQSLEEPLPYKISTSSPIANFAALPPRFLCFGGSVFVAGGLLLFGVFFEMDSVMSVQDAQNHGATCSTICY